MSFWKKLFFLESKEEREEEKKKSDEEFDKAWRDIFGDDFEQVLKVLKTENNIPELEIKMLYNAVNREIKRLPQRQAEDEELERKKKEATGLGELIGLGLGGLPSREVSFLNYKIKLDIWGEEKLIQAKEILELRFSKIVLEKPAVTKESAEKAKQVSPAERERLRVKNEIEMRKARQDNLVEAARARDESLAKIDQKKNPELYALAKRQWDDYIHELMEQGR